MQASQLQLWSYGYVAINKPRGTDVIEVTPMEQVSLTDGELTDNAVQSTTKGKDASGASFEAVATNTATIEARWLPFGSNRSTSPDVRRGEKVAIYRFADADKYYWTSLEYESKLRKLETVVWTFSDTRDESASATAENTYFLEISTHDKLIHLHTSKSDQEPFIYDFVLNTKEGTFTVKDDIDNTFHLDSKEHRWFIINTDKSYLEIVKEDVNIHAVRDINLNAGRHFTLKTGADKLIQVGGKEATAVASKRTVSVGSTIDYSAPGNMNIEAPKVNVSDVLTTGSNVQVGGGITTGVGGAGSGGCTFNGPISINGGNLNSNSSATFSGTVTAANIH